MIYPHVYYRLYDNNDNIQDNPLSCTSIVYSTCKRGMRCGIDYIVNCGTKNIFSYCLDTVIVYI